MVISKVTSLSAHKLWQAAYKSARKGSVKDIAKFMEFIDPEIQSEARIYAHNVHDFNDFCQHTREYILQILQTKKEAIKKVQNYFMKTIRCEMIQCAGNSSKINSRFVSGAQAELLDDKSFEFAAKKGIIRYCNDNVAAYCDLQEVLKVIRTLPKKVQRIILAPISNSTNTSKELSEELNMTPENIDKIRERTRKMLKKMFTDRTFQRMRIQK